MTPFARSSRSIAPISAYWLPSARRTAGHPVEVAESRDVLRERDRIDGGALEGDRSLHVPEGRLDLRLRVQAVGVLRKDRVGQAHLAQRERVAPVVEVELAELDVRPGGRLLRAGRGVDGELHRLDRAGGVAAQLAAVRDAGVGREVGPEPVHRVERVEGLVVAAELDEGVADDAVVPRDRRRERVGLLAERQRLGEPVARRARASRGR